MMNPNPLDVPGSMVSNIGTSQEKCSHLRNSLRSEIVSNTVNLFSHSTIIMLSGVHTL